MQMKQVICSVFCSIVMAFIAGCASSPGIPTLPTERGWQNFPTARTFDYPGTLFAIDNKGVWRSVGMVKTGYQKVGHESVADTSETRDASGGLAVKLLGLDGTNFTADLNQKVTITVRLPDGYDRYRLLPANFRTVVAPDAINQIGVPESGWHYFIVQETKASKKFDISMVAGSGASANFSTMVKQAVNIGAKLSASTGTTATFQRTFDEDHNVLFLAQEIVFPKVLGAFPTPEGLKLRDVKDPIPFIAVEDKR